MICGLAAAVVVAQAQATEFEKARLLRGVQAAGITANQMPLLLDGAQRVAVAMEAHTRQLAEQRQAESPLASVFQAVAAGVPLNQEQRRAFEAAELRRAKIDADLQEVLNVEADRMIARLTDEQRTRLSVSDSQRRQVTDTIGMIRSVSNAEWPAFSQRLAMQIAGPDLRRLRVLDRGAGEAGRNRETRREDAETLRRQTDQIVQGVQQRLARARQGDGLQLQQVERMLVAATVSQEEATRRLRERLIGILGDPASVPALRFALGR
jgi:hypothetical protein